jgi:hypothetical protein
VDRSRTRRARLAATATATAAACLALAVAPGLARADGPDRPGLPPVLVKRWQLDDGLPQAHVQALAQTSDGYLWVGTLNEGPARFDGVRFTALRDLDPVYARRSHRDQVVNALLATPDGALWIGTEGGGSAAGGTARRPSSARSRACPTPASGRWPPAPRARSGSAPPPAWPGSATRGTSPSTTSGAVSRRR